jgi:hypothetical protein
LRFEKNHQNERFKKRERTKVKNPITGEVTWKWRDKITIRYAEEEKLPIILEFLKGDLGSLDF